MENNLSTTISIEWQLDIDTDEMIQNELNLTQKEADAIVLDSDAFKEVYDSACELYGLPHSIDMTTFFSDPHSVSPDQITDALSDEYGWLVYGYKWLEACNSDSTNVIINYQHQPNNPQEDNMANSNISTPNSSETTMTQQEMITNLFKSFTQDGGMPKITDFKKHIDMLIKSEVKPLCARSGKSADGNDWRSVLKAQFGGRGAKWVQLDNSLLESTLDKFDAEGLNTADYRKHTAKAGFSWIRFNGPRINDGIQSAAFEVRIEGSTIDHPRQLHYVPVTDIETVLTSLGGTPHGLKLELDVVAKPQAEEPPVNMSKQEEFLRDERIAESMSDEDEYEVYSDDVFSNDEIEDIISAEMEGLDFDELPEA